LAKISLVVTEIFHTQTKKQTDSTKNSIFHSSLPAVKMYSHNPQGP